ncbi:MAG: hypothetical protein OEV34_06275 [Gammaproteobacteria bacterium]|jgi:hypothetical protein|nr:hypothetical protein [Gammaproteobacteria bacterium]
MLSNRYFSRKSLRHRIKALTMGVTTILLLSACATSSAPQTQDVFVAEINGGAPGESSAMTRVELEAHVRRFSDRYITRIAIAANAVIDSSQSLEGRRFMEDWKNVSFAAIVDVAIGPDAVTNLMDMMVLTMLSRMVVEDYWAPKIADEEVRLAFLQAFHDLEQDIWTVADDVLTPENQEALADLVAEWHGENPEQVFPWYVRLSNFSGQRAASLNAVKQSGGMLAEVARAREAAEEMQAFGERVLFYLQRAPMMTSGQFESSVNNVFSGPEVTRLLTDVERFVIAADRLVQIVDDLPESRLAAVDQLMDRLGEEREAMMATLAAESPEMRQLLVELLPILESVERTVAMANVDNPNSRPFDINEYTAMVDQSAATVVEMRLLVESVTNLMAGVEDVSGLTDAMIEIETAMLDRFFLRMVGFLVIFFLILIASRFVWVRIMPKQ